MSLCLHQTQMAVLQKKRRQNLLICAKLSSVVGFPWISAFFGIVFPTIVAFEYFVRYICLLTRALHRGSFPVQLKNDETL